LASIGLYQVNPGSPYFTITVPQFKSVVVHLENGNFFSIQREPGEITGITWNGGKLNRLYLSYEEIMHGGLLRFESSSTGELKEGDILRTSMIQGATYVAAPVIKIGEQSFSKDTWVEMSGDNNPDHYIQYTIKYANGKQVRKRYSKKFKVNATCTIIAQTINSHNGNESPEAITRCFKRSHVYTIDIKSTANPQYFAGGAAGLLDGIHGDVDWRKGYWHGYQGQDFEAIIDTKKTGKRSKVSCTFLCDNRSWIYFPSGVELFGSIDGQNFISIKVYDSKLWEANSPIQDQPGIAEAIFHLTESPSYRYYKVVAKSFGNLPKGHPGEGNPSFIFIDEIDIQ